MKKIIEYAIMGLGIGFVCTTISIYAIGGMNEITKQFLGWMIASVIFGVSALLYTSDKINQLAAAIIHMVICGGTTLIVAYILGYAKSLLELAKEVFPLFIVIYVVIYGLIFLFSLIDIKRVNKKLNNL